MESVAIIGRGIIGSAWGLVFARAGRRVSIWDRTGVGAERIQADLHAAAACLEGTDAAVPAGAIDALQVHANLGRVLEGVDYIQESAPENLDLKRQLLKEVSEAAPARAIIGSSTSGLLPSVLAEGMTAPERFLVVHPLTPPHLLPVTEIVPGANTAESVVEASMTFMSAVGQAPVRLHRETAGFVANRILGAMLNEFFHLIGEGVIQPEDADAIITQGFGLRWACIGPFAAMDLNAPGGIADYLTRYGGIFRTVAAERNASCALDADLIETMARGMRARHPLDRHAERAAARDRAIARLRSTRDVLS